MAERPDYVRHRSHGGRMTAFAAIGGVALAAGALAALAWGVTRTVGADPPPPPPPPAAAETEPPPPVLRIVFPEGFTRAEMAARVREVNRIARRDRNIEPRLRPRQYLRWSRDEELPQGFRRQRERIPHLEGFLFPATYDFTPETTSRQLVRQQLQAFSNAWEGVELAQTRRRNLTPYDVLIIASMIEKEVQVPRERALVSAVIHNRLRIGLPLGIDATIRYGFDIPPTEPIRQSHLDSDNPYNTRRLQGLPPTPIANPGLPAIQAAAHPANVDFLYFVRKPDCKSHFFTASHEEFESYTREGLQC